MGGYPKDPLYVENPKRSLKDVYAERCRQIAEEGWSAGHDASHTRQQLAMAAACYAAGRPIYGVAPGREGVSYFFRELFPWASSWDKREKHDRRRQLVIAGALILAELDRLDRQSGA